MKKQVAILGGTFDPIHNGHLKLAENAFRQFRLDEIWFMPAPNPPHKTGREIVDFQDRAAMVRLAIAPYEGFVCSEFETQFAGKSYTSETLTRLNELYPDTDFFFVVGADSFYEFGNWHEPETISKLATIIVAERDYEKSHSDREVQEKYLRETFGTRVLFVRAAEVDISSNHIRRLLRTGKMRTAAKLLPAPVLSYIRAHRLYLDDPE